LTGVTLILLFYIKKKRKEITILIGSFILIAGFVYSVNFVYEKVLEPHQKDRIDVLIGKNVDLKGIGYNVNQSKIAIGSGGFFGKGFLQGTQTKFNFVPEQSTDFIFCTIGEEWGFVGSTIVIILYIWLFLRIIMMAERQRSAFSRIYGYGVAAILFFHFVINIAMTIGLAPVIGIPLPFISYGGSSLWAFTLLLFVFIKQDANRLLLL
jgi:rod shape determining protein RodA